jgi:hypothetical protein
LEEKATQEHADKMESEGADQTNQRAVTFSAGEDLSHDVDYSYGPDDPKENAERFEEYFHEGLPYAPSAFITSHNARTAVNPWNRYAGIACLLDHLPRKTSAIV